MRKLLFIMFILCTIKCVGKGESHHVVTATYYNPVESQCSSNPLITADGSKINLKKLKEGKLRWIAISRDLRENYKYGDIVIIESDDYRLNIMTASLLLFLFSVFPPTNRPSVSHTKTIIKRRRKKKT